MRARLFRPIWLVALLAVAGCGGDRSSAPEAPASPAAARDSVVRAADRLRAEKTFSFEAEFTETKKTGKRERYMTLSGSVDLAAGEGRTVVDLTWLDKQLAELRPAGAEEPDPVFAKPIEVRWNRRAAFGRLDGRWERAPREQMRGSLLGRAAEEPAQLVSLLRLAEDATSAGTVLVDGAETTRVRFTVDARRAGGAGVPAELYRAFEAAQYGPKLDFEAWIDADGLPLRIAYWIEKGDVRMPKGGKIVIPAKTIRGEYRLSGFGDDVDTAAPSVTG